MAVETHVAFAYAYVNMHSQRNAGKFYLLSPSTVAERYVAAMHGALCKYAHIPSLSLFEIAGLLFVFDIAICLNNDI